MADEDSETILANCQRDLQLLKKPFQGRRRMEYRKQISYAVRLREYQRSIGKLKRAIQSITGTYIDSLGLEEIVARKQWAEDQAPPVQAELQKLVTETFEQKHRVSEELQTQPGILTGDISSADVMELRRYQTATK